MCLTVCQYVPILIPHFNALIVNGLDLVLPLYIFLSQLNSRIIVAMQTYEQTFDVYMILLYIDGCLWINFCQNLPTASKVMTL